MFKLEKAPREEKVGCLFALIGILIGLIYNNWAFDKYIAKLEAADPDAEICGLPYVAGMLGGMIIDCFAGAVVGMVISRCLMPKETEDER